MAQTFSTSLKNVAVQYARLRKLKITASSIKTAIEENPYYPSLLSLSDTFTKFKVPNNGFKVDKETFEQLELPLAAYYHISGIGREFVLVTNITENTVSYLHSSSKKETVVKKEFLNRYQEVVWMAEPNEQSGESGFEAKLQLERKSGIRKLLLWTMGLILLVSVVVFNVTNTNALTFMSIFLIKLMGLAVTILLLAYEFNKNNIFIRNICSGGVKTSCEAVLDSRAAKIGNISWSELGFLYFAATTIFLLLPVTTFSIKIAWLTMANAFAAPYILFSIYYQWRVVKNWCPLCLITQAVLLFELIWSIANFWINRSQSVLEMSTIGVLLFSVVLPITIWYTLKPEIKKANDAERFEAAYKRLHHNPVIFNNLLQQQEKVSDGWQHLGITIGNPAAVNHIIKVCNPYCNPCAKAHRELEELLREKDIKLTILFNATGTEDDITTVPALHLLALAAVSNEKETQHILDEWYYSETKSYDEFAKKYPVNGELDSQAHQIEKMQEWCKKSDINYTPTIFLNEYRLPENYNLEELKSIL